MGVSVANNERVCVQDGISKLGQMNPRKVRENLARLVWYNVRNRYPGAGTRMSGAWNERESRYCPEPSQ